MGGWVYLGTPFADDQGRYEGLTLWEQIDNGQVERFIEIAIHTYKEIPYRSTHCFIPFIDTLFTLRFTDIYDQCRSVGCGIDSKATDYA